MASRSAPPAATMTATVSGVGATASVAPRRSMATSRSSARSLQNSPNATEMTTTLSRARAPGRPAFMAQLLLEGAGSWGGAGSAAAICHRQARRVVTAITGTRRTGGHNALSPGGSFSFSTFATLERTVNLVRPLPAALAIALLVGAVPTPAAAQGYDPSLLGELRW